jgi:hypothetical protein
VNAANSAEAAAAADTNSALDADAANMDEPGRQHHANTAAAPPTRAPATTAANAAANKSTPSKRRIRAAGMRKGSRSRARPLFVLQAQVRRIAITRGE